MNEKQNTEQQSEDILGTAVARFELNEEQMGEFLALLEEEPKVLPKLQALFARKSVFE